LGRDYIRAHVHTVEMPGTEVTVDDTSFAVLSDAVVASRRDAEHDVPGRDPVGTDLATRPTVQHECADCLAVFRRPDSLHQHARQSHPDAVVQRRAAPDRSVIALSDTRSERNLVPLEFGDGNMAAPDRDAPLLLDAPPDGDVSSDRTALAAAHGPTHFGSGIMMVVLRRAGVSVSRRVVDAFVRAVRYLFARQFVPPSLHTGAVDGACQVSFGLWCGLFHPPSRYLRA
jgi:hypothetical protein